MVFFFFFQAEDGIRDAQESRGLGDVYKRQVADWAGLATGMLVLPARWSGGLVSWPACPSVMVPPVAACPDAVSKVRHVSSGGLADSAASRIQRTRTRSCCKMVVRDRRTFGSWMGCCRGCGSSSCLLYTSDAADEEDSVDLGGRRI